MPLFYWHAKQKQRTHKDMANNITIKKKEEEEDTIDNTINDT